MEQVIILLVVILLGGPLILGIAAIARTFNLRRRLDQLDRRLDLQERILREIQAARRAPEERTTRDETAPAPAAAAFAEAIVASVRKESPAPSAPPPEPEAIPETPPLIETQESVPSEPTAGEEVPGTGVPPPRPAPEPASIPPLVGEPAPQPSWSLASVNWEQYIGVKLFAWVGGLALFLAVAFFVKYSFDNDLIPPSMRVGLGFLTGLGLIIGGLKLSLEKSPVTVQTLCATGIVILYADIFAAHAFYTLLPSAVLTFLLMILVTATAFLLAIRLNAQVVALLGLLGGFLTPVLLSTGKDNPVGLFGYLAILNAGLAAVALRQGWSYQVLLASVATVIMEFAWVGKFFASEKILVALAVFLVFAWLPTLTLLMAHRRQQANDRLETAAFINILSAFAFVLYLLWQPHRYRELAGKPGLIFGYVFLVDLAPLAICWCCEHLRKIQLIAGGIVFFLLTTWTIGFLQPPLLYWALGLYLIFAVLHSAFPITLQQGQPQTGQYPWLPLFPIAAAALMILPVVKLGSELSWVLWPAVLLVDFLALAVAVVLGSLTPVLVVIGLSLVNIGIWIGRTPVDFLNLTFLISVLAGFTVIFFSAGLWAGGRIYERMKSHGDADKIPKLGIDLGLGDPRQDIVLQTPLFSALLPFFLLMLVIIRMPLPNPSAVFGLALVLVLMLFYLARAFGADPVLILGLLCTLALELLWFHRSFTTDFALIPLGWHLVFYAVFMVFPFFSAGRFRERMVPWAVSALSGPAHFYLIYQLLKRAYPHNPYPGLIPAVLALPAFAALIWALKHMPSDHPKRNTVLALFGGSALFFITLIMPIQFDRQWITIGWALEGTALIWLFHRVPHPGLRLLGVILLGTAFIRLALNQRVLSYWPRSEVPIFNWFLYAYGLTTLCLMAGARLLAPPRNLIGQFNAPPVLYSLATLLAFLLLNIEIADFFSSGTYVTFQFSGNLKRDMAYSLAWTTFAFLLFILGILKDIRYARYAGLGLLTITLLKIFLHDLWRLGGLYRIGSIVGLAVALILVSFIYQRFLARGSQQKPPPSPQSNR